MRSRFFYGWVIVAIAFIMMAVGYTQRSTFAVFYPVLVEEFGWDRGNTALIFSISIIVYGLAAPVAGRLVDRLGPRVVFPFGVCLMSSGIALCSVATQQWHFYVLYGVVAAVGLSMVGSTPLNALIANWFVRKRALAFGIYSTGFGVSLLASPLIQSLITGLGRQRAYLTMGIATAAIVVPLVLIFMRRSPGEKGTVPDGDAPRTAAPGATAPRRVETTWMRTEWTVRRAVRTRQFWLLFVADMCLMGVAQQTVIAHSVYLFRDSGFGAQTAANAFSFYGVGITIGYLCANLSDRIGRERVIIPGCLLAAAATALLFLVDSPSRLWLGCVSMFFCGLGMGAMVTTFFATIADLFQGRDYGAILGLMTFGFSIGGAFSPWFAGWLHDVTGSYSVAVALVVSALLVGAALVALVGPHRLRPVRVLASTTPGGRV
ncbi:MAG: MFS transporter [Dehalococcoidia bacterium]|jgi:MFS family permease|nr:MFS transporter [Dehalococcoidia bacterium]